MLKIIPPKFVSTGEIYCGASSGYKPAKIITAQREKPSTAITSNNDISSWNTNTDIVFEAGGGGACYVNESKEIVVRNPYPIEPVYMLDETGCITTDSSEARSILYQEVKGGHIITHQQPVSDMDREIAKLWNILEEINKDYKKRELMWQHIREELDYADQRLEENRKTSYKWEIR